MNRFYFNIKDAIEKRSFQAFLVFFILWLIFHLSKKWIIFPIFLSSYFDDFLVVPMVLTFSLFLQQIWVNPLFIYSKFFILSVILYFGILFEIILARYIPAYTSDIFDLIAYFTGGIIFYIIQKFYIKK